MGLAAGTGLDAKRFEGEDLGAFSALIGAAAQLPWGHWPGASPNGCAALELRNLQRRHTSPDCRTLAVWREGTPVALALVGVTHAAEQRGHVHACHVWPGKDEAGILQALMELLNDTLLRMELWQTFLRVPARVGQAHRAVFQVGFRWYDTEVGLGWVLKQDAAPGNTPPRVSPPGDDADAPWPAAFPLPRAAAEDFAYVLEGTDEGGADWRVLVYSDPEDGEFLGNRTAVLHCGKDEPPPDFAAVLAHLRGEGIVWAALWLGVSETDRIEHALREGASIMEIRHVLEF